MGAREASQGQTLKQVVAPISVRETDQKLLQGRTRGGLESAAKAWPDRSAEQQSYVEP